jgi:hypothetical protein
MAPHFSRFNAKGEATVTHPKKEAGLFTLVSTSLNVHSLSLLKSNNAQAENQNQKAQNVNK